jgi:hypothetical protein
MAEELKKRRRKRKRCRTVKRVKRVDGVKKVVKVRKCRKRRKPNPGSTHPPAPVVAPPAPGPAPEVPPAPPAPSGLATIVSPIGVYAGPFGRAQAERLLWRAGFGPRPGQADALAAMGLEAAVTSLTRPTGVAEMDGPEPTVGGQPFTDPFEEWYGDTLWWFDRMVRSRHQLIERLALVFHDWWATSNDAVGDSELTMTQTNVFRAHGLGSFAEMTRAITVDPAILCTPEFHEGPRMVKPPVVLAAGLLRALDKPITGEQWVWLCDNAGQRLYYPPDVAGWDDRRWLDTNTIRARWEIANYTLTGRTFNPGAAYPAETPEEALASARAAWGDPTLTPATVASLAEFAASFGASPSSSTRAQRQNALRQLIAASPDYQTC